MMGTLDFLVMALAVWRVSSLLVNEQGPFDMFLRLRKAAGIIHDENKEVAVVPERFWPQLLSCIWCTSMWVAIATSLLYCLFPMITIYLCLPFALSAGAITVACLSRH